MSMEDAGGVSWLIVDDVHRLQRICTAEYSQTNLDGVQKLGGVTELPAVGPLRWAPMMSSPDRIGIPGRTQHAPSILFYASCIKYCTAEITGMWLSKCRDPRILDLVSTIPVQPIRSLCSINTTRHTYSFADFQKLENFTMQRPIPNRLIDD